MVSFEPLERLGEFMAQYNVPFEGLADPERAAYAAFGLGRGAVAQVYGPAVWLSYVKLLLAGQRAAPIAGDTLQLGGDFLLDAEGRLLLSHPSRNPTDRPTVETILAALLVSTSETGHA